MIPTDVQRIQFRHDTLLNWVKYNPVLEVGEPAYETDTGKVKYGNGVDRWSDLPYAVGATGPQGPEGPVGPVGPQGPMGSPGTTGPTGPAGPANSLTIGMVSSGATADALISGTPPQQQLDLVLPKGPKGDTGLQGVQGAAGPAGPEGPVGPAGPQGPEGIQGPKGDAAGINLKGEATTWPPSATPVADDLWLLPYPLPPGTPAGYNSGDGAHYTGVSWVNVGPIRGPIGPQGPAGSTGPTGPAGAQGATGPQGVEGPRGPTGPVGPAGPAGPANQLTVNAVIPILPEEMPLVAINGVSPNQSLDFYLPVPYRPTLSIGTVTEGDTAAASITGTSPNFILNLVLPRGSGGGSHTISFTQNPSSVSVTEGDTATFTANAESTESPIIYQWEEKVSNGWQAVPGSGGKTFTINAVGLSDSGREFRCVASTASAIAWSSVATLTVTAKPPADGTSWTSLRVASHGGVTYQNGFFYMLPYRSSDGETWQAVNGISSIAGAQRACLYGNGFYYTGFDRSSDGVNFTPLSIAYNATAFWLSYVPFRGGEFMVSARVTTGTHRPGDPPLPVEAKLYKMANGVDFYPFNVSGFTSGTASQFIESLQHHAGPNMWIGVARMDPSGPYQIVTSPTGATWTSSGVTVKSNLSANPVGMAYTNDPATPNKCVCVTEGNTCWTSTDGTTWVPRMMPTAAAWTSVGWGNGRWMAIAANSTTVATSQNGINWTMLNTLPAARKWQSLAYGSNIWLASSDYPANLLDLNVARSG